MQATSSYAQDGKFKDRHLQGDSLHGAGRRPQEQSHQLQCILLCRDVLVGSRTARLERKFVQTGKAYSTSFLPAFPGTEFLAACQSSPNLQASLFSRLLLPEQLAVKHTSRFQAAMASDKPILQVKSIRVLRCCM